MVDLKKLKASPFCRNHPKHRQSPGVCSLCLMERLSKLGDGRSRSSWRSSSTMVDSPSSSSSSSSSISSSSFSYTSSYYSSSASSPSSSPGSRHLDTTTPIRAKTKLAKSRSSMLFFPRFRLKEEGDEKNPNAGIWSKLIGWSSRRKQMKESLKHSRTARVNG